MYLRLFDSGDALSKLAAKGRKLDHDTLLPFCFCNNDNKIVNDLQGGDKIVMSNNEDEAEIPRDSRDDTDRAVFFMKSWWEEVEGGEKHLMSTGHGKCTLCSYVLFVELDFTLRYIYLAKKACLL